MQGHIYKNVISTLVPGILTNRIVSSSDFLLRKAVKTLKDHTSDLACFSPYTGNQKILDLFCKSCRSISDFCMCFPSSSLLFEQHEAQMANSNCLRCDLSRGASAVVIVLSHQ